MPVFVFEFLLYSVFPPFLLFSRPQYFLWVLYAGQSRFGVDHVVLTQMTGTKRGMEDFEEGK